MEVGEICGGSTRSVESFDIWSELNQIAADESCGQAEVPEHLAQQPGGIAAGAFAELEGLLRSLHARFEADDVLDVVLEFAVEGDEEINAAGFAVCRRG